MSGQRKVMFSARLNADNPDKPNDGRCIAIRERWRAAGWSDHDLIVRAMLGLEGDTPADTPQKLVKQLQGLVKALENLSAGDPVERGGIQAIIGGANDMISTISRNIPRRAVDDDDDD